MRYPALESLLRLVMSQNAVVDFSAAIDELEEARMLLRENGCGKPQHTMATVHLDDLGYLVCSLCVRDKKIAVLEGWKKSAEQLLDEIDLQALGKIMELTLGESITQNILPKMQEYKDRAEFMLNAATKQNHIIEQILAQAIGGYPWYVDDQVNFPGTTRENGVCVGDQVAESLAADAADLIKKLRTALAAVVEKERT